MVDIWKCLGGEAAAFEAGIATVVIEGKTYMTLVEASDDTVAFFDLLCHRGGCCR
jgi:hypothetical protein